MAQRLGIFGGTFDPPHLGHFALATSALEQLNLDAILWVLTPQPPHKPDQILTSWLDRLDMLQVMLEDHTSFKLSRVEIDRPGPHYAVDTMRLLQMQYPGAQLTYLMGDDSLRDLPTWHNPKIFVAACHTIGVISRPGVEFSLDDIEAQIPGITQKLKFVQTPAMAIASSRIRQKIQAGHDIRAETPSRVADIIQERGLYR